MSRMSSGEGLSGLPHVLTRTFLTGNQIDNVGALAIHFLFDGVYFPTVCALESVSLH